MLVALADYLSQYHHSFHVFHYITLRAIFASLTALAFSLCFGPSLITWLSHHQMGQMVRDDGPQSHLKKQGTPTMGGVLILCSVLVSVLLWADLSNHLVWVVLMVTAGFGAIGWYDDYQKIIKKNSKGLSARGKLLAQSVIALMAMSWLYLSASTPEQTGLIVPFFKDILIPLGAFYVVLGYFVIVGSSNAVNLTDGLDGLAILPAVMVAGALAVFAYASGHMAFSEYLAVPYVQGAGEVVIICASIVGAGLGFLWFNAYPAQVFMGDVGSLALGAALGIIAVVVRQEIVFFLMSGVFVLETVSVMLQVASFKLTGKRVFKMAPIHHHFELKGWAEPKVIVRFWIMTFILVLMGLATLKLR